MTQGSPDENGLRKEPAHHVGTQNCPRTGSRGPPGSGMLDPLGPELPLAVLAAIYVVTIWVLQYMPRACGQLWFPKHQSLRCSSC